MYSSKNWIYCPYPRSWSNACDLMIVERCFCLDSLSSGDSSQGRLLAARPLSRQRFSDPCTGLINDGYLPPPVLVPAAVLSLWTHNAWNTDGNQWNVGLLVSQITGWLLSSLGWELIVISISRGQHRQICWGFLCMFFSIFVLALGLCRVCTFCFSCQHDAFYSEDCVLNVDKS